MSISKKQRDRLDELARKFRSGTASAKTRRRVSIPRGSVAKDDYIGRKEDRLLRCDACGGSTRTRALRGEDPRWVPGRSTWSVSEGKMTLCMRCSKANRRLGQKARKAQARLAEKR